MKIRIQFTPELTIALFCAAGWFAFWLLAFRPAAARPVIIAERPEVIRLIADDETLSKLKAPTLFALPSGEGFSGQFFDNRVDLHLSLEKPPNPVRFLPREHAAASGADRTLLISQNVIPQSALQIPEEIPYVTGRPAGDIQLFLSPELETRAEDTLRLNVDPSGLPETVRVNLSVRSDGTVEHAFFETPVTNTALLSAVRKMNFKPAAERTESWMDIRFVQEKK